MKTKKSIMKVISIALITLVLLTSLNVYASVSDAFELTPGEARYLSELSKREIVIAGTSEIMSFAGGGGEETGIMLPLIELLRDEWGLKVKTVAAGWGRSFEMLESGEVDLMGLAVLAQERKEKYYSTEELLSPNMAVYTRVDDPLGRIVNVAGKSVGMLSDSTVLQMVSEYVKENTVIRGYGDVRDMFEALGKGEIDCVVAVLDIERELLKYPSIRREMAIESIRAPQGLYSGRDDIVPLIEIINRYLSTPDGERFRSDMRLAVEKSVLQAAKLEFAAEIKDLHENYGELNVYDSCVLYPLSYVDTNGEYRGFQLGINEVFNALTGKPINVRRSSEFEDGFITAIEEIQTGGLVGATSVYYNDSYSKNPAFRFSSPIMNDKLGFYSIEENPGKLTELKIGSTKFGSPYIDWASFTGNEPVILGSRGDLLRSLKNNELDAIFISEMTVDYYYSVQKDYSLIQINGITAPANFHMLMSSENESFNKLFDVSIMLHEIVKPNSREQWLNVPRDYKFAFMRVHHRLDNYETIVVIFAWLLIGILAVMYFIVSYQLKRFSTYDTQISRMLTLQKNADMLWGNIKKGDVVSKGGFPLYRKWGYITGGEDHVDDKAAVECVLDFGAKDLEDTAAEENRFVCREIEGHSPKDGSVYYAKRYTHKIRDNEFMTFLLDITEEKSREKELYRIANIDFLSELMARRAMDSLLIKKCQEFSDRNTQLYVMMLDIDDFKKINDNYGHDIGDRVLKGIAEIIRTDYAECPAARWGGEEFLMLAEVERLEDAVATAEDLLRKVEREVFEVGSRTSFSVTISCGISMLENAQDYPEVVTRADAAMYQAKSSGKNCVKVI